MKSSTLTLSITLGVSFIILCLAGCPQYMVWRNGKLGEAELRRATFNRKIITQEAEAKSDAAEFLAQADTTRAHGIARSNEIIGQSLNNNSSYLTWLWLDELSKQQNVIYIPTENGMPIMEATRFSEIRNKKDSLEAGKK